MADCVCTVTSRDYLRGTLVTLASFLRRHPGFAGDLVVIHDDLGREERSWLEERLGPVAFRAPSASLGAAVGSVVEERPDRAPRRRQFYSLEALALQGYRKVVFCDSDLLFLGPVWEALDEPGDLLACPDRMTLLGRPRSRASFEAAEAGEEAFQATFNAGFLVYDGALLGPARLAEALDVMARMDWPRVRVHTDQAVLNRMYEGRFRFLESRFNHLVACSTLAPLDDVRVVHFSGARFTPWNPANAARSCAEDPARAPWYEAWGAALAEALRTGSGGAR